MLGTPYLFAGTSTKGIDASGLVVYCYKQIGISVPHSCDSICKLSGYEVERNEILPGDVVLYKFGDYAGHAGIYVGNGEVIHASTTDLKVVKASIDIQEILCIKRIVQSPSGGFKKAAGWKEISGKWYYFEASGVMTTGWKQIDGTWYYLEESGAMAKGWLELDGTWYYLNRNGSMATGWNFIGAKWYFFDESGAMATGWKQFGGISYFLGDKGDMAIGWKNVDGKWYYFGLSGNMATGWKLIGLKWYYFDDTGEMKTGSFDLNGIEYIFGKDGALVEG